MPKNLPGSFVAKDSEGNPVKITCEYHYSGAALTSATMNLPDGTELLKMIDARGGYETHDGRRFTSDDPEAV
jgi:hypothetical protein